MTDLLPCPFCGNPPIYDRHPPTPGEDDSFVVVRCASCGISKEWNYDSNAIKWWNTRAPAQAPRDHLRKIVAEWIMNDADRFDLDDFGYEAADDLLSKLYPLTSTPSEPAQAAPGSEAWETVRKVSAAREKGYAAARANLQEAWAALAMIRETVETLAPSGAVKASEHLDGPTFMHEAEALVAGILTLSSTHCAGGVDPGWDECPKCGATSDDACAVTSTERVNSTIPCSKGGHKCRWPACPADCEGRPGTPITSTNGNAP